MHMHAHALEVDIACASRWLTAFCVLLSALADLLSRLFVGALTTWVHVIHLPTVLPDALGKGAGLGLRTSLSRPPAKAHPSLNIVSAGPTAMQAIRQFMQPT